MLSRTDSIGDVMLTLPMAGVLKGAYPACRIIFLGRTYTREIISVCSHIDEFRNYDELSRMKPLARRAEVRSWKADVIVHVFPRAAIAWLAFRAGIPHRAGTRSRLYHWLTCNHRVKLPRRTSDLHEAQLNIRLLGFLQVPVSVTLQQIPALYGFTKVGEANADLVSLLDPSRNNVILHPRSKGSAVEWGLHNFDALIRLLPEQSFRIFITGTAEDGAGMKDLITAHPGVKNLCGRLSLRELIEFISHCDALVAASTGPLHIAAALGIKAIGLYSPRRPLFPQRWGPVGPRALSLVADPHCEACRSGKRCSCIQQISPELVADKIKE